MDSFVSLLTKFIIFFGLYLTIFWILVMLNDDSRRPRKQEKHPDVTILIPAYNEEKGVERTIRSVMELKYNGKIEVIVINDNSSDRTLEIAKKYKDKIRIIDLKKRSGKARALNIALKEVKTEFVAILDADSTITKSSLENGMSHFFSIDDPKKIGAVVSKLLPENTTGTMLERIQHLEYMMVGLIRHLTSSLRLLDMTVGVLSIYRTKVIVDLKGFDENNLTEDFELGVRIRKSGYYVIFAKDALVYTKIPSSFHLLLKQRIRWARGFIQTHIKHRDVFFRKKYGFYGFYQFPMDIIAPLIFFAAIFTISYHIYKSLYEFFFKLIVTPAVISWFDFGTLQQFFLGMEIKTTLLLSFNLLLFLYLIYSFIQFYNNDYFRNFRKNKFRQITALVLYILVFNYIYLYIWITSLLREIFRAKFSWGTK